MKKHFISALLTAAVLCMTACESWLDQTADSEIRAEEHYSTVAGFQQTLTGCYIGMTDASLYGQYTSWFFPELLGRQFKPFSPLNSIDLYLFQYYAYTRTTSKGYIDALWAKAYNVIVNANEALLYIDAKADVLGPIEYSVIKGELLAIRAYMHFDLIRLFGYGNWSARKAEIDAKNAVPYLTTVDKNAVPQLSMKDFFSRLTDDLKEAARLLKEQDPITCNRPWSDYEEVNADGFYDWRNLHLNYYAVRALQARAYLWEGSPASKELAREAAEEVIADFLNKSGKIGDFNIWRWMTAGDVTTYPGMGLEQLFALNVPTLQTTLKTYYITNYTRNDHDPFFVTPANVDLIYEESPTDWRAWNGLLEQTQSSTPDQGYVSKKLLNPEGGSYYYNRVPLIRLPEMYYIAAECYATGTTPDPAKALELLNIVREKRGLYDPLPASADVMEEIRKEYRKEFLAEGVMFYYYKRLGFTEIPDFEAAMGDAEYVLPYPDFETESGRIQ